MAAYSAYYSARHQSRHDAQKEAGRAMLAALKHARSVLMSSVENRNRASENLVWLEIKDAIAQAEAAGIKEN